MKKFNLTFNKKMFEFAINDFVKNINFVIDEIKVVEIVFNELFIFVIAMNEHNDIIFFDYEYITFFVHNVVNNQIEFNCFRIIKYMSLSINCYKDILNFVESYKKELNKIRLRQ